MFEEHHHRHSPGLDGTRSVHRLDHTVEGALEGGAFVLQEGPSDTEGLDGPCPPHTVGRSEPVGQHGTSVGDHVDPRDDLAHHGRRTTILAQRNGSEPDRPGTCGQCPQQRVRLRTGVTGVTGVVGSVGWDPVGHPHRVEAHLLGHLGQGGHLVEDGRDHRAGAGRGARIGHATVRRWDRPRARQPQTQSGDLALFPRRLHARQGTGVTGHRRLGRPPGGPVGPGAQVPARLGRCNSGGYRINPRAPTEDTAPRATPTVTVRSSRARSRRPARGRQGPEHPVRAPHAWMLLPAMPASP